MHDIGRDDVLFDDARLRELAQLGARSAALVHDVNNLLQVALRNLELVALQPLEDATRERISRASASLTKCAGMMSANLSGTKEGSHVCVSRFVADRFDFLKDVCGAGITLNLEDASNNASVRADERGLESALINLLINARDAMNGVGHVSIVCDLIENDRHQALRLCVLDDGPGIPHDIQATVFNRFVTTKSAGRGLGLPNVRKFVDENGGTIRLESKSGLGTSIAMFFPVLSNESAYALDRFGNQQSRSGRKRTDTPSLRTSTTSMVAAPDVASIAAPDVPRVESPPTGFLPPEIRKGVLP